MAGRDCANGSMTRGQDRMGWMRRLHTMRPRGCRRCGGTYYIERERRSSGVRNDWFGQSWIEPAKLTQLTRCHPRFLAQIAAFFGLCDQIPKLTYHQRVQPRARAMLKRIWRRTMGKSGRCFTLRTKGRKCKLGGGGFLTGNLRRAPCQYEPI